jgi:hypothetical protein
MSLAASKETLSLALGNLGRCCIVDEIITHHPAYDFQKSEHQTHHQDSET